MLKDSRVTNATATLYVLSGICQPLLMTKCKLLGIADPRAQLYMLFYYLGPSCLGLLLCVPSKTDDRPLSRRAVLAAGGIAIFDILAQTLNYTGAGYAGATIFAVIYSSVTVWTALFGKCFLGRSLQRLQWVGIAVVFVGLGLMAVDSQSLGPAVVQGTALIVVGSCMHGGTYVLSEAVMQTQAHDDDWRHQLHFYENAAVQSLVACGGFLVWTLLYVVPNWNAWVITPMNEAGTSIGQALYVLVLFGLTNLLHSASFYHTLAHYPGGSASAGVLKGLQAVLVLVAAHVLYCSGQPKMCFGVSKLLSLLTVVGGVALYSSYNAEGRQREYNRIPDV